MFNSIFTIFENENPGLPMRVDHGRMLALAQVEGMMTVINDEKARQMKF